MDVGDEAHHILGGPFCLVLCKSVTCPSHVCHVTDLCRAYAACVIMAVESVNMTYMMTILPSWYDTM
jgi:hypothetical protein